MALFVMNGILYSKIDGYKYRLDVPYNLQTDIKILIASEYVVLFESGMLNIRRGYCWDGASGPTIDTEDSMRASLIHDALYQLIRDYGLPRKYKGYADRLFYKLCLADGMPKWRAWLWYQAVRLFGRFAL